MLAVFVILQLRSILTLQRLAHIAILLIIISSIPQPMTAIHAPLLSALTAQVLLLVENVIKLIITFWALTRCVISVHPLTVSLA